MFQLIDGQKVNVCKTFFLHTLGISEQMVSTALKHKTASGVAIGELRKQPSCKTLPVSLRNSVHDHIRRFPTIPSHCCRQNSEKEYLEQGLTIAEMYRLYAIDCQEKKIPVAKQWLYDSIFRTEFNWSFFVPKKDQCDLCEKYKNSNDNERDDVEMAMHMRNKELAREKKQLDKEKSKIKADFCAACYDLQQILVTPRSMSSQLFYRRKLATYNLTVYDLGRSMGHCYVWHEGMAKRGCKNIASCVWNFIKYRSAEGIKTFSFFTDNCAGQNKNRVIFTMYLHAVRKFELDEITHSFLEKGHTQNEGDSVHAVIEKAVKHCNVYVPAQWYTLISMAKKVKPSYIVTEMGNDMIDFGIVSNHYTDKFKLDTRGQPANWNSVKIVQIRKESPQSIFLKHSYDDDIWQEMKADRHQESQIPILEVEPLLKEESSVTAAKKKDLLWMCEQLIIPREYHAFFQTLKTCNENESASDDIVLSTLEEINVDIAASTSAGVGAQTMALKKKMAVRNVLKKSLTGSKKKSVAAILDEKHVACSSRRPKTSVAGLVLAVKKSVVVTAARTSNRVKVKRQIM